MNNFSMNNFSMPLSTHFEKYSLKDSTIDTTALSCQNRTMNLLRNNKNVKVSSCFIFPDKIVTSLADIFMKNSIIQTSCGVLYDYVRLIHTLICPSRVT